MSGCETAYWEPNLGECSWTYRGPFGLRVFLVKINGVWLMEDSVGDEFIELGELDSDLEAKAVALKVVSIKLNELLGGL